MISKDKEWQKGDPPPYSSPSPSAPPLSPNPSHGQIKGTGCTWSISCAPQPSHNPQHSPAYPGTSNAPVYQLQTSSYPAVPNHAVPSNPFNKWKSCFDKYYPDSKMSRDTPSIMKVEMPKNRAYPVIGHAACPECFDLGPHTKTTIKLKSGFLSSKKHPAQKCKSCYKLVYFIQTSQIALDPAPTHRPPPYVNISTHSPLHAQPGSTRGGHGWSDAEQGHGWNDGEGHGWGH